MAGVRPYGAAKVAKAAKAASGPPRSLRPHPDATQQMTTVATMMPIRQHQHRLLSLVAVVTRCDYMAPRCTWISSLIDLCSRSTAAGTR